MKHFNSALQFQTVWVDLFKFVIDSITFIPKKETKECPTTLSRPFDCLDGPVWTGQSEPLQACPTSTNYLFKVNVLVIITVKREVLKCEISLFPFMLVSKYSAGRLSNSSFHFLLYN